MKQKVLKALQKIPIHFFFWSLVWFFFFLFFSVGSANKQFLFWFSTLLSFITIVATYHFVYVLIPKYLIRKKYQLFLLYSFYALVFIVCAVLMTVVFGFVFFFNLEFQKMPALTKSSEVIIVCVLLMIALASAFKILKLNSKSLETQKNLENRFLQMQLQLKEQELKFLKLQIHPHFLFNTLNTIYGFALKKSDETPNLILKLSSLLDYILYQVEQPLVFVKDEIDHIQNYIALEKSRFQEGLQVDFFVQECNQQLQIPPMLMLPFVENAFKHGVPKQGVLCINLKFMVTHNSIEFIVENSSIKKHDTKKGIGLENINKRLQLLYPKTDSLTLKQTEHRFHVHLKIPIKNEV